MAPAASAGALPGDPAAFDGRRSGIIARKTVVPGADRSGPYGAVDPLITWTAGASVDNSTLT
ncbi:MAG TPA: hypothetical protein DEQ61_14335 [Streptomyces sp.]|nr:hypothetical protein [Streptomyces sp.]